MQPAVLAFSGSIASGKSTLSEEVAGVLQWSRVSFGDYVRFVARSQGLAESREVLQAIGADLVERDLEGFCRAVLAQVDWKQGQPLIIDGIRHTEVLGILRQLVNPMELHLIFVMVDEVIRVSRLREREQSNFTKYQVLELDSTEEQVTKNLEDAADLIVNSVHPVEVLTREITSWLLSHCTKNQDTNFY